MIPVKLYWILCAAAFLIVVLSYVRGLRYYNRTRTLILAVLRLIAISILLFMLAGPILCHETKIEQPASMVVMIDTSESMNVRSENLSSSRFENARTKYLDKINDTLDKHFDVKIFGFSSFLEPMTSDSLLLRSLAEGNSTDIGGCLDKAVNKGRGSIVSGVILLSDGVHNSGPNPLEIAPILAEKKIPVYTVGFGGGEGYKDLEIIGVDAPSVIFQKKK